MMTTSGPSSEKREQDVVALLSTGMGLLGAGKPADLLRLFARAFAGSPSDPRVLVQKAYAHALLGQIGDALADAARAQHGPLIDLWALDLLGNVFTLCHQPDRAYTTFAQARRIAPNRPDVLFNFAAAAGFLGLTEEAEGAYDRVIAMASDNGEAWLNRSLLRRQTREDNHVQHLLSALGGGALPWQREVHLRYALGKELEDLGDHDGAFTHIARGAAVRRQHMRYAVTEDCAAMDHIAAAHDADWCAPARANQSGEQPIFILGMPRSGSTLLERMLGRHTRVQALGELPCFGQALIGTFRDYMGRMPTSKAELIAISAELDPSALAAAYLAAVAPLRDARPRSIDKLPINFLYAGLIARALPGAVLLHIRRDPLDLCFAIFKTLFRDAYPFSYDLAELGAYHRAYQSLMDHWRRALGNRLVEIDYEELVTAPRTTLEALLPRLGLPFEDACLSPERDHAGVMTASAAQVRQPIHSASVGSAARYARHLGPLRAALAE